MRGKFTLGVRGTRGQAPRNQHGGRWRLVDMGWEGPGGPARCRRERGVAWTCRERQGRQGAIKTGVGGV